MTRRAAAWGLCLALAAVVVACGAWVGWEALRLPQASQLRESIYVRRNPAADNVWMPLWAMSGPLQTAVVVWEDPAFYHHGALNPPEIARALWLNLRAGGYVRGASTITQQVVKNQLLGNEKTLRRKLREAILAYRLEQVLTKDQILTLYLNVADWGDGVVGAEVAARRYFGKPAAQLEWAEAALLAGMLPNPRVRNPCVHPVPALAARGAVLAKLREYGHLTPDAHRAAQAAAWQGCAGEDGASHRAVAARAIQP